LEFHEIDFSLTNDLLENLTPPLVSTSLLAHEAGPLVVFLRQLLACYTIAAKLVLPFDMVTYDKHIR
jgi:hypothetical protein